MKVNHGQIDILSAITKIGMALHSAKDLEDVLNMVTKAAVEELKIDACTVKVINERRNKLDIYSQHGLSELFIEKLGPYAMFKSHLNQLAMSGSEIIIENIEKEDRFKLPAELSDEGFKSVACMPIALEDQIMGVLSVYNKKDHSFDKEDLAFLKNLALQCGAVIYSLRRYRRMETLMNISRTINSSLDLNYVLKEIVVQAARVMKVRAASLRLLDEASNNLILKSSFGLSKQYLKVIPDSLPQSPIDKAVLENRKIIEMEDMTIDSRNLLREAAQEEGLVSMLCVPLVAQDKAIGILKIYTAVHTHFTDEEKNFLMAMSELGATAIRNAALYEKLHSMFLITNSLSATNDIKSVMDLLTMHSADYLKGLGAQVVLWDKDKERFTARSVYKLSESFINKLDMNKDWCAQETLKGNTIIASSLDEDDRFEFREMAMAEGIYSLVSMPLKAADKILGILQVFFKQCRNFSTDEIEFLTSITNHGAIELENAKLHEYFKNRYEELVDDIYVWHDWTSHVIRS